MTSRFGRLTRLPAAQGRANEPGDFTPWLAENLQELGDSNQRVVIVENQFGQTDRTHLGRLLTYWAGALPGRCAASFHCG
jgi:hypothetical protein